MQVGIKDIERTNEDNIIFSFVMNGGPVPNLFGKW